MNVESPVDAQAASEIQDTLKRLYAHRFARNSAYRKRIWAVLATEFFSRWIPSSATVLDLGSGYGEFINNARAGRKYAMDLNPDAAEHLSGSVSFLQHDCSTDWPIASDTLDVVFTSNFFEHLPDKVALSATLREAFRCLKHGGRLIAIGPNIRYVPGRYWDFYDHHIPLSDASLAEALVIAGFQPEAVIGQFLPYTAVNSPEYPLLFLRLYLAIPLAWRILGKQFLVVAKKPLDRPSES
jgi:SAM-dependent methyltransferase